MTDSLVPDMQLLWYYFCVLYHRGHLLDIRVCVITFFCTTLCYSGKFCHRSVQPPGHGGNISSICYFADKILNVCAHTLHVDEVQADVYLFVPERRKVRAVF